MFTLYFVSGLLHASGELTKAIAMLKSLYPFTGLHYGAIDYIRYILQFLAPLLIYEGVVLFKKDEFFTLKLPWPARAFLVALAIYMVTILERVTKSGFIYFAF